MHTIYSEPNKSIFQFVSPEVCYSQDSFKQLLQGQSIKIKPLTYLYGYKLRENSSDFDHNSSFLIYHPATNCTSGGVFLD